MTKWWSNHEPLNADELALLTALYQAHAQCVFRPNCSSVACQQAAGGSRSLPQSIIAALACLGEMHGPIEGAYDKIKYAGEFVWISYDPERPVDKVPGWGNSFVKGQLDPAFLPVDQILEQRFPRSHARLKEITDALHARGKHVFPNPASYTAATSLILGMPRHLSPMLFVQARIEAWSVVFHQTVTALQKGVKKEEEAA